MRESGDDGEATAGEQGARDMATWAEFELAAPDLAAIGRRLLFRGDHGEALLSTVRAALTPRLHPIGVGIVDGRLVAFITASPKRRDLQQDGRYALHNHMDLSVPEEFMLRGHASSVADPLRSIVAAGWYFTPDETYELFSFDIDSALVGARLDPDEWPPRYRSWTAGGS
ncbi:MAG TPA: hypothetical protein VIF84_10475 [Candidatus Limnocylindrales bacterium]|jgi:hypothetical protein